MNSAQPNLSQDTQSTPPAAVPVAELNEPNVVRYFETLNAGAFEETAALFEADGALYPPLEEAIAGAEAIASYLAREAEGIACSPNLAEVEPRQDGARTVRVRGKVKMPYFGVHVAWTFEVGASGSLQSVAIRLLASPQELLNLQKFS